MIITQKKLSNKHIFNFEDQTFNFAYEDKTGSGDVDMDYAHFPRKSSVTIVKNEWLRNVGLLWCAIGALEIAYAVYRGASLSGNFLWPTLGIGCLVWAYFTTVKYTVFKSDKGSVFVIQDSKHDEIIEEINWRRKKQLLEWYGEINPKNELQVEIDKFNWLKEQGVMTKEEADNKIAQVELAHKDMLEPSDRLLN